MEKYIRYKNHKTFISNDDWESFEILDRVSRESVEELNSDIVNEVKIRYEIGESKGKIIIDELKKIREMYHLPEQTGYGFEFEIFALSTINNIDYEYMNDNYKVEEGEDGKVDAIDWSHDTYFKVYQFKLGPFDSGDIITIKDNINEFLTNGEVTSHDSKNLNKFLKKHKDNITRSKKFEICVVSSNRVSSPYVEHIDSFKIFDMYFQNKLLPCDNKIELILEIPKNSSHLPNVSVLKLDGQNLYVYFDKAQKIINSFLKCEQINGNVDNLYKLFSDNVRKYLGDNKKMQETIDNDPTNFVRYNNGITITGEVDFRVNSSDIKVINPVINNGQQTFMNLVNNPHLSDDLNVLVIIKSNVDDSVKSKIAEYTNSQRNIKPIDLLSLNYKIREIQKYTYENTDFFLNIYSSGKNQFLMKAYDSFKIISIKEFLRCYFSCKNIKTAGSWKNAFTRMLNDVVNKGEINNIGINPSLKVFFDNLYQFHRNFYTTKDKKKKSEISICDLAILIIMNKYSKSFDEAYAIIHDFNEVNYKENLESGYLMPIYKKNDTYDEIIEYADCRLESVPC